MSNGGVATAKQCRTTIAALEFRLARLPAYSSERAQIESSLTAARSNLALAQAQEAAQDQPTNGWHG